MNDSVTAPATPDPPAASAADSKPGYSPYRLGVGVGLVLVLASIFLFLSFFSLWADRQILDGKQWTETSTRIIEQPAVQEALSNYLVDQLFDNVDVENEIKQQLPSDWEVLASPATSALRSITLNGTKRVLELPIAQQAWAAANAVAHDTLITVLEGGDARVSTEEGVVTVSARTILEQAAQKLGLSGNLVRKIPPDAGTFVIYRSDDLATAQAAYKVAKDLKWIFAVLTIALYVLAIALAAGRRRRAVIWMGASFVIVALLVLIAQSLGRTPVVDSLAQTSAVVPAVTEVYDIATELLRRMANSLLVTGLLVLLATMLAGPYAWAVATRRFLAPYLRDYLALSAAGAALLFLIVLWLVPLSGFRNAVGLTLNAVLAVAGFIALVTITRREFPDAQPADFGAAGDWISRQWRGARELVTERMKGVELPGRGGGPSAPPPSEAGAGSAAPERPASDAAADADTERLDAAAGAGAGTAAGAAPGATSAPDDLARLERLQKLHADGALTDAEFAAMKRQILGND